DGGRVAASGAQPPARGRAARQDLAERQCAGGAGERNTDDAARPSRVPREDRAGKGSARAGGLLGRRGGPGLERGRRLGYLGGESRPGQRHAVASRPDALRRAGPDGGLGIWSQFVAEEAATVIGGRREPATMA